MKYSFRSKDLLYHCLLWLIVVIAVFFRFFNTPARYGYDFDPTRDALVSIHAAKNLLFPLTGPQSGIGPFAFGPWYYYQLILAELILPFDYAPWLYIGATSVLTVFVMYKVGELLENKRLGLIVAFLTALSPAELGPITGLSNPNLVPIQAAISLYIFILFAKKTPNLWWALLWGLSIGIGISNHYQMLGFMILPVVTLFAKRMSIKQIAFVLIGVIIVSFPSLLFEVRTNWVTTRGLLFYFFEGRHAVYVPNSWGLYLLHFWPRFFSYVVGVPLAVGIVFIGIVICVWTILYRKKIAQRVYGMLFIFFATNIIALRYLLSQRETYYFIYLHSVVIIFAGVVIWYLLTRKNFRFLALIMIGVYLFFVVKEDVRRLQSELYFEDLKYQTQIITSAFPNQSIAVFHCGSREKQRTQAIVFFLEREKKLSKDGIPIGMQGDDCESSKYYLPFQGVSNIGRLTDQRFLQNGIWQRVTPETVYNETMNWYTKK